MNEFGFILQHGSELAPEAGGDIVLHIASVVVMAAMGIVVSVLGFLIRRDINRTDKDQAAMAAEILELRKTIEANDRRHGYEINDTRRPIDFLYSKAGIEPPEYPSR